MQPSYFTKANIDSACTISSTLKHPTTTRTLRFRFSARDLPEPDSRSRASYAVIYHATQSPSAPSSSSPLPNLSSSHSESTPNKSTNAKPSHISILSDASADSASSSSNPQRRTSHTSSPVTPHPQSLRRAYTAVKNPDKSSALRAPHLASAYAAPHFPTSFIAPDGTSFTCTAWSKLGNTEIARKNGRDVEFATSFAFAFNPRQVQLVRVVFYDSTCNSVHKQRLIGTAQFQVASVFAAKGKPVTYPLTFMPVTKKDIKRSSRIPVGALVVSAERITAEVTKYNLDIECSRIMRTKALSLAPIKRIFYTVHAILDQHPDSDHWTLIFRSDPVEMIHKKRDGGSLEYNHFSSRRLVAEPGAVVANSDAAPASPSASGITAKVSKALGIKKREQFFSLPGAYLPLVDENLRLKLTLFEDSGQLAGSFFIANTEFTIADLKQRNLGDTYPVKVHANVVGRARLKYVECGDDPRYFCISLELDNLR